MSENTRESMDFDVVIVGGGPSGLAAAIRLMQLSEESGRETSVCLVEKGSEIGAHILSGAIMYPLAMDELLPDWRKLGAPATPVGSDDAYCLINDRQSISIPQALIPEPLHNKGNFAISLGNMCRWMGEQAESMGVMLFPGFAATEILYKQDGAVCGVATGDMGIDREGNQKSTFQPGYELRASYTLLAEGCRGNLGKQLISKFDLAREASPQHYAIGLKELWEVPQSNHELGKVVHTLGWPLGLFGGTTGGGFLYHVEDNQLSLGLIVDLAYSNPHLSPFDEFQRWKTHPLIKKQLIDGRRISYGARAIVKGGYNSLPKLGVPGAALIGDDAGFLNTLKVKGSHTAIKSGMLGAEAVFEALSSGQTHTVPEVEKYFEESWLYEELFDSRNAGPAWHKFGMVLGSAWSLLEQSLFRGQERFTLRDIVPDHKKIRRASQSKQIQYPRPDGVYSFDKLSSVFLSNTNHEEDQPCHLVLEDETIPIARNFRLYREPAQLYCPAGVYEVVEENGEHRFQINAQNCVHCKTCDIKDPAQNITWVPPEGSGGPNYPNM
ncbi:MAG: electron transfer flavoprotein-ubiquinone oxidoreductase [Gammaproteobacteria bacterium]|nr:electron transfer flavoprotein-ubiquinone oxidoreductase [Gammaproteobacteria bacterium]MYD81341.1 electron transfer flavoprotein-ubiquinone oxidoreductase [Gammaproteobacteria bacterium]